WLYTFYGIAQVPSGDGSGMQWIAIMPLGLVFLVLTLPALIFALSGFLLRFAIGLGIAGLVAFALLWNELLKEFYHYPTIRDVTADWRAGTFHSYLLLHN